MHIESKQETHARISQQRYKHDYDCSVRETSIFESDEYVFLGQIQFVATMDQNKQQLAISTYQNLFSRSTGPLCIISVQQNTVSIDKHGVEGTITINSFVHSSAMPRNSSLNCTPPSDKSNDKSWDEGIHTARPRGDVN